MAIQDDDIPVGFHDIDAQIADERAELERRTALRTDAAAEEFAIYRTGPRGCFTTGIFTPGRA